MDKKQQATGLKIACGVLIFSFFLNWISVVGVAYASACGFVFDSSYSMLADQFGSLTKIILLLPPLTAGVILYYNIKKKGAYPLPKKIIFCLPAACLIVFFLIISSKVNELNRHSFGMADVSATGLLAVGFWLSLLASAFLVYLVFGAEAKTANRINKEGGPEPNAPVS